VLETQELPSVATAAVTPALTTVRRQPAAVSVRSDRRRPGLRTMLASMAALAVVAVVGVVLLVQNGADDPGPASVPNVVSSTAAADESGPATPTEEQLEDFATSYVTTAADDPEAGFALLTPDYQDRSPDYTGFWGTVENPEILDVSADPKDLTVTYTYRYQQDDEGEREETVTLHLVQDGDRLLIDDAVSSG
jgi:hypothetical protein